MRLADLYVGGEHAHGNWDPATGKGFTVAGPATDRDWELHLAGEMGLGLVPVRLDGTCRFAAIDIDVDTIDHAALLAEVRRRGLPLNVCRSKSGGAHLYLLAPDPGRKASELIPVLRRWATALGFPKAEVFPKQARVTKKDPGNWINLPYFGADGTTRYAQGPAGAYTLVEFLMDAVIYTGEEKTDEALALRVVTDTKLPPCLGKLAAEGVTEGGRNAVLFNYGVYARKAFPDDWEDKLREYNQLYLRPPITEKEIRGTCLKSLRGRKYQYTCNEPLMAARCDRAACAQLPHGVGHMPWEEADTYDQVTFTNLRKVQTDPPRYLLEVNGADVELDAPQMRDYPGLSRRAFETLDLLLPPMKKDRWDLQLKGLLASKTDIAAPPEASLRGLLWDKVQEYLALSERTRGNRDDLLRGLPVEVDGEVLFRADDLRTYLRNQKFDKHEPGELFTLLHLNGATTATLRVKGKVTAVWRLTRALLNRQTEDFEAPKFSKTGEEL